MSVGAVNSAGVNPWQQRGKEKLRDIEQLLCSNAHLLYKHAVNGGEK